jgi:hypothetical protein
MIDYSTERTLGALLQDSVRESRRSLARLLALSLSRTFFLRDSFDDDEERRKERKKERKTDRARERATTTTEETQQKSLAGDTSLSLYPRIVKGRNFKEWRVGGRGDLTILPN